MTFDINAPIERQFTRDGRKVLAIYDSGLDCKHPIAAWIEGNNIALRFTKYGDCCWDDSSDTCSDIITRPKSLPLVVTFHNVYPTANRAVLHDSLGVCEAIRVFGDILASIKTTFNPNTGISTAETVWQKGPK